MFKKEWFKKINTDIFKETVEKVIELKGNCFELNCSNCPLGEKNRIIYENLCPTYGNVFLNNKIRLKYIKSFKKIVEEEINVKKSNVNI